MSGADKASRVAALRAQVAAIESGSALAGSGAAAHARLVAVRLCGIDVAVTACDGVVHPK
ncbi:hypothetical protein FRC0360_02131 [Corynebacterium diphtheriae]|nr:hypothetical protein FRC0360_02131 [Corynebacterium diphtheriae]CAB1024045.1 hypothetical protein FRC0522_02079 [Corynebacterium diphtheriae]